MELFDALVQILLPLGQLLEAVEHLQLFLLLRGLRRRGLSLRLVSVLGLLHLQLVELLLIPLLAAPLAFALALSDLIFASRKFEERLISRLLGGQGGGEWRGGIGRLGQMAQSRFHFLLDLLDDRLEAGITHPLLQILRLFQSFPLGLLNDRRVLPVLGRRLLLVGANFLAL